MSTALNPVRWFVHAGTILEIEARKLVKDPWEMVIRAIQPLLWLTIFGSAFAKVRLLPGSDDYTSFLAPGILAQSVTFAAIFFGITLIWEKDLGLTQKYLASPLARSALVVGKLSAAGLRGIIQGVVILAVAGLLGAHLDLGAGAILGTLAFTVLGAAFFAGLSMGIAALLRTRSTPSISCPIGSKSWHWAIR
jgi:ABC-2 type transport system permease protein